MNPYVLMKVDNKFSQWVLTAEVYVTLDRCQHVGLYDLDLAPGDSKDLLIPLDNATPQDASYDRTECGTGAWDVGYLRAVMKDGSLETKPLPEWIPLEERMGQIRKEKKMVRKLIEETSLSEQ